MTRCQNYKERSVVVKYVKQYSRSFLQKYHMRRQVVKMINIMTTEDEKKTALATS